MPARIPLLLSQALEARLADVEARIDDVDGWLATWSADVMRRFASLEEIVWLTIIFGAVLMLAVVYGLERQWIRLKAENRTLERRIAALERGGMLADPSADPGS